MRIVIFAIDFLIIISVAIIIYLVWSEGREKGKKDKKGGEI